jgi:TPP-dependent pyruvate/acetoin dehydrogenase alpha subunit
MNRFGPEYYFFADTVKFGIIYILCLRRIFGPQGDEVTEEWRKLHNEELNILYSSLIVVRVIKSRMRWAGHAKRMGEGRAVYRILVGKPAEKRPMGRHRRRWEDNLRKIFRKWDVCVWTGSSWLRIGTGGGHM